MTVARSLLFTAIAATASAQVNTTVLATEDATTTITRGPSATSIASSTASSNASSNSNIITTSILWGSDEFAGADSIPGIGDLSDAMDDLTIEGSILTVGPSGTVVDIACPFTMAAASGICDYYQTHRYTLRPSGYDKQEVLSIETSGAGATIVVSASAGAMCSLASDEDVICTNTVSLSASVAGQSSTASSTTTVTYSDPTYTPLYITGGLEKTGAIPEQTAAPGAAGSLRAGSALVGAVGAVAAAVLAF